MLSPFNLNNQKNADNISISSNGNLQSHWLQHIGGVQFLELCY